MPSLRSTSPISSPASGSSPGSSRSAASTIVTAVPNLANAWASSTPTAPPPATVNEAGADGAEAAERFPGVAAHLRGCGPGGEDFGGLLVAITRSVS
jgi:hypothetical protein